MKPCPNTYTVDISENLIWITIYDYGIHVYTENSLTNSEKQLLTEWRNSQFAQTAVAEKYII